MLHPLYLPKPPAARLWQGSIMVTIASSLYTLRTGFADELLQWKGDVYLRSTYSGGYNATKFVDDDLVIVMFDPKSSRVPVDQQSHFHEISWYLDGMPTSLQEHAEQMIEEYFENRITSIQQPLLTGTTWSQNGRFYSRDPWPNLFWHGLAPLHIELQEQSRALRQISEGYYLTETQTKVLLDWYDLRVNQMKSSVIVNQAQLEMLIADRPDDLTDDQRRRLTGRSDDEGVTECRDRLRHVNIIIP